MRLISNELRTFCEVGFCKNPAEVMAYDREAQAVLFCCEPCAEEVIDRGQPEYHDACPNCDCRFGVN